MLINWASMSPEVNVKEDMSCCADLKLSLVRWVIGLTIAFGMPCYALNAESFEELDTTRALAELKVLKGPENDEKFLILGNAIVRAYVAQVPKNTGEMDAFVGYANSLITGKLGSDMGIPNAPQILSLQSAALEGLMSLAPFAKKEQKVEIYNMANTLLSRCRKQAIPNFEPLPVALNIAPPVADPTKGVAMTAGMDPEAIKDPKAKAAYLKAIAENSANRAKNLEQLLLQRTMFITKASFIGFASTLVREQDLTKEKVLKDFASLGVPQEEIGKFAVW